MKISIVTSFARILLCAILLVAGLSATHAAIVVVAPTASAAGSFTITSDITFTITTRGNARAFVLNEWVVSDGHPDFSSFPASGQHGLTLSIDGRTPQDFGTGSFVDNRASTVGQITANDGDFEVAPFLVFAGDTVTLKAASYTLSATSDFNPQANQMFTGGMFITDSDTFSRISDIVSVGTVPEPATWLGGALLTCLVLGSVMRRHRRIGSFCSPSS